VNAQSTLRNPAVRVAVALVAGFVAGIALRTTPIPRVVEPLGTLWVNAIRMPVLPLIVMLLISAVGGSRDTKRVGALGLRALGVFFALAVAFVLIGSTLGPWLLSNLHLDPASTASLRETARIDPKTLVNVTLTDWLVSLIPNNPVRAAADGALLPLVIFSIAYGLALSRVDEERRVAHVLFCHGVADAMTVIIRAVLVVTPIGVFALAMTVGARIGASAAGAIGTYIAAMVGVLLLAIVLLYIITITLSGVPLRTFAAAMFPAQTIGISSRSSLAALPVLMNDMRTRLGMSESVTGFVLPLGASIFKLNAPVTWTLGAVLVANLYGVPFAGVNLIKFAIGSVLLSFAVPGIPSGGFFVQAPLYVSVGLPPEGLGLLIAVDLIPDMFKTTLNVTSYASAALLAARPEPEGFPSLEPAQLLRAQGDHGIDS
jgi:Na+/H+-dicarboxylate symporter